MRARTYFIGSEIYRASRYGRRHPLAIPRVSTVMDLARALHWLPEDAYLDSPTATVDELCRFHDPAYVAAVQRAEREQRADAELRERYNIGRLENPVFGEVFRRPATAAGASLLAAELIAGDRADRIYTPAGGTHHGRPDRASGFCFFNDPVLCILRLKDRGVKRIAYVDLDAHHCDGVEDALHADPSVLTVSLHEHGRWPHDAATEQRHDATTVNLALPRGAGDAAFRAAFETGALPRVRAFDPQVVIVQAGADALADDPLSRLELSNRALWRAVRQLDRAAEKMIVLGGGGYNPWSVARCWTGIWGVIAGYARPSRLPEGAEAVLRGLSWRRAAGRNPPEHWFTTLADPLPADGPRPKETALA
ncbi:MAG: acetoin utilization protein [Rhizobiales bacterium NRL2]|jgi:acetoin utilization protein AcuC|nr:MAG: acetoin utilization protein [Rhizobiales bacterium NRL2]